MCIVYLAAALSSLSSTSKLQCRPCGTLSFPPLKHKVLLVSLGSMNLTRRRCKKATMAQATPTLQTLLTEPRLRTPSVISKLRCWRKGVCSL